MANILDRLDRTMVVRLIQERQGDVSLRSYAKRLGISPAYLSDVYRGRRDPGPTLLRPLGLTAERRVVTTYRRHFPSTRRLKETAQ